MQLLDAMARSTVDASLLRRIETKRAELQDQREELRRAETARRARDAATTGGDCQCQARKARAGRVHAAAAVILLLVAVVHVLFLHRPVTPELL